MPQDAISRLRARLGAPQAQDALQQLRSRIKPDAAAQLRDRLELPEAGAARVGYETALEPFLQVPPGTLGARRIETGVERRAEFPAMGDPGALQFTQPETLGELAGPIVPYADVPVPSMDEWEGIAERNAEVASQILNMRLAQRKERRASMKAHGADLAPPEAYKAAKDQLVQERARKGGVPEILAVDPQVQMDALQAVEREGLEVGGIHRPPMADEDIPRILWEFQRAKAAGRLEEFREENPYWHRALAGGGHLARFIGEAAVLRGVGRQAGRAIPALRKMVAKAPRIVKGAAELTAADITMQAERVQRGMQPEISAGQAVFTAATALVGGKVAQASLGKVLRKKMAGIANRSKTLEAPDVTALGLLNVWDRMRLAATTPIAFGTMGGINALREILETGGFQADWSVELAGILSDSLVAATTHRISPFRQDPRELMSEEGRRAMAKAEAELREIEAAPRVKLAGPREGFAELARAEAVAKKKPAPAPKPRPKPVEKAIPVREPEKLPKKERQRLRAEQEAIKKQLDPMEIKRAMPEAPQPDRMRPRAGVKGPPKKGQMVSEMALPGEFGPRMARVIGVSKAGAVKVRFPDGETKRLTPEEAKDLGAYTWDLKDLTDNELMSNFQTHDLPESHAAAQRLATTDPVWAELVRREEARKKQAAKEDQDLYGKREPVRTIRKIELTPELRRHAVKRTQASARKIAQQLQKEANAAGRNHWFAIAPEPLKKGRKTRDWVVVQRPDADLAKRDVAPFAAATKQHHHVSRLLELGKRVKVGKEKKPGFEDLPPAELAKAITAVRTGKAKIGRFTHNLQEGVLEVAIDGKRYRVLYATERTNHHFREYFLKHLDELYGTRLESQRGVLRLPTREESIMRELAQDKAIDNFLLVKGPEKMLKWMDAIPVIGSGLAKSLKKGLGWLSDPRLQRILNDAELKFAEARTALHRARLELDKLSEMPTGRYLDVDLFYAVQNLAGLDPAYYSKRVLPRANAIMLQARQTLVDLHKALEKGDLLPAETIAEYREKWGMEYAPWKFDRAKAEHMDRSWRVDHVTHLAEAPLVSPGPIQQLLGSHFRKRQRTIGEAERLGLITSMDAVFDGIRQQINAAKMVQVFDGMAKNGDWVREPKLSGKERKELAELRKSGKDKTRQAELEKREKTWAHEHAVDQELAAKKKAMRALVKEIKDNKIPMDQGIPEPEPPRKRARILWNARLLNHRKFMEENQEELKADPEAMKMARRRLKMLERAVQFHTDLLREEGPRTERNQAYNEAYRQLLMETRHLQDLTGGWKLLTGEKWGILNGRMVNKMILSEVRHLPEEIGAWGRMWDAFLTLAKKNWTARNPTTHVFNLSGNFIANSILGLKITSPAGVGHLVKATQHIADYIRGRLPTDPIFQDFWKSGRLEKVAARREYSRKVGRTATKAFRDASKRWGRGEPGKAAGHVLESIFTAIDTVFEKVPILRSLEHAYGYEDQLQGYWLYRALRTGKGSKFVRPMSHAEAIAIFDSFYNYDVMAPAVKSGVLGRRGLYTFSSFTYKAFASLPRGALKTGIGLPFVPLHWRPKGVTGSIASLAWNMGKWFMWAGMWNEHNRIQLGVSDEEWDQLKYTSAFGNEFYAHFQIFLGDGLTDQEEDRYQELRHKENRTTAENKELRKLKLAIKPLFFDASAIIPMFQFARILEVEGRRDPPVLGQLARLNIFASAGLEFITGMDWLGARRTGLGERLGRLARPLLPGGPTRMTEIVLRKRAGYTDQTWIEAAARSLGVKARRPTQMMQDSVRFWDAYKDGRIKFAEYPYKVDYFDWETDLLLMRRRWYRKLGRAKRGQFGPMFRALKERD